MEDHAQLMENLLSLCRGMGRLKEEDELDDIGFLQFVNIRSTQDAEI
jgi:hypothetical protein